MTALAVRPWVEDDRKFVVETFLDSYRTAHAAGLISMEDWKDVMGVQFSKILARPRVSVLVACNPQADPASRADLYGWLAVEYGHDHPLVIYVYVKQPYRRMGIARRLMKAARVDAHEPWFYAAKTPVVNLIPVVRDHAAWTPLALRFPPP